MQFDLLTAWNEKKTGIADNVKIRREVWIRK